MIIKYAPRVSTFPPLETVKPYISEHDRHLAQSSPPPALPLHCKPWADANSYGLLVRYPYKAVTQISVGDDGKPVVNIQPISSLIVYKQIVQTSFSISHFGLDSGYLFKTDHGIGLYTNSLPNGYESKARVVSGLVQTWWYPKNLFLVFALPEPGEMISFKEGDPLCVLMPVVCEQMKAELMTPEEVREAEDRRAAMRHRLEQHPELQWRSAEGETFSHVYKVFAAMHRSRHQPSGDVELPQG